LRAFDEVEEVLVGVAEEEDAAAADGDTVRVGKGDALFFQLGAGGLDGGNAEGEVAEAGAGVVGGVGGGGVAGINFDHEAAGQGEEVGGGGLAIVENEFGFEDFHIPIFQGGGVEGREAEVFDAVFHGGEFKGK
jgi:hypothetical protein